VKTPQHAPWFPGGRVVALALGAALLAWIDPSTAQAATRDLKIRWQLSPDADVSKYRIHRGTRAGQYDTVVEVTSFTAESGGRASTTLRGLNDAVTYYFSISAVDAAGQSSSLSNEISIAAVPAPAPAPAPTPTPAPAPTPAPSPDSDGDGLSDAQEAALGTLPGKRDTDSDGMSDGDEVRLRRNPRVDEIKLLMLLFQD
jgi:hypothetical protein